MTDAYRFDESSTEKAIAYAKIYAGTNYSPAMETVLKVAFSEKRNLPTFRLKSSDTNSLRLHAEMGGGIPGRI